MSAKYKELLQQLESEDRGHQSDVSETLLYPSRIISLEDDSILQNQNHQQQQQQQHLLSQGATRKRRGAQQVSSEISQVHYYYSEFKNPRSKHEMTMVANDDDDAEGLNAQPRCRAADEMKTDAQNEESEELNENNMPVPVVSSGTSLNQILPHIPCTVLRDRIKQLTPIIDKIIFEWRLVTDEAGILPSPFAPNVYPEMPVLQEVVEFSDFVKNSLDVCGLSSLDAKSLATMQRVALNNELVARRATDNYEDKEHKVLEWIFKSQTSTIRALRADIGQLRGFVQHRGIILNHCQAVLGCISASIERVVGSAATERTCQRERLLLSEVGRTGLMLASKDVTAKEQADVNERLANLPFRDRAIRLYDLVNDLTASALPSFNYYGHQHHQTHLSQHNDSNDPHFHVEDVGILITTPSNGTYHHDDEDDDDDDNDEAGSPKNFFKKNLVKKVKDLAAAHNRIRIAEELADDIMKEIRKNESVEEERWNKWNEKYQRAMEKMNSAVVIHVEADNNNNSNGKQLTAGAAKTSSAKNAKCDGDANKSSCAKNLVPVLVSVQRSRTIEGDN